MRILYVVHQFYPKYVSGTEQYVLALARAGRQRGDDVRVFSVDPDFRDQDPPRETRVYEFRDVPVTLYRFEKAAVRNHVLTDYHNPEVGGPFRQMLEEFRPQLVHFFHLRWLGLDRLDEVVARGIPAAAHVMDFWYVCPNFLLLRPDGRNCDGPPDGGLGCFDCVHQEIGQWARQEETVERVRERAARGGEPDHDTSGEAAGVAMMRRLPVLREKLAQAACVFAPSRTVRDLLLANGHRPARLELAPYAVDWSLLREIPAAPESPIVLGFLGTLAPHKGLDVMLEALRELSDPDLRLRVHGRFGDFPDFDDRVRALADGDSRIEFAGGFSRDRLPEVLGGLHAVVVPSRWRENTPFVCLEARAAGLPVVASDLSGMAEAVPEGRGRLFRPGDARHLREVLTETVAEIRQRRGARLEPDTSIPDVPGHYEQLRGTYRELAGNGAEEDRGFSIGHWWRRLWGRRRSE